jgi:O-acetyl-ADP-ribose deacetylase (regulator of RNase III)
MGAGVALQIRNRHPECFLKYEAEVHGRHAVLGDVVIWNSPISQRRKRIFNALTQPTTGITGKHVSYDAVHDCFKYINEYCLRNEINEINFPLIGAGLGGGSWPVISAIIMDTMDPIIQLNCIIYEESIFKSYEGLNAQ